MKLHNFKMLDTGFTFLQKSWDASGLKSGCSPPKVNQWSKGVSVAFVASLVFTFNR